MPLWIDFEATLDFAGERRAELPLRMDAEVTDAGCLAQATQDERQFVNLVLIQVGNQVDRPPLPIIFDDARSAKASRDDRPGIMVEQPSPIAIRIAEIVIIIAAICHGRPTVPRGG